MLDVKRNLTTIMDFYELTMAAGYLEEGYEDKISVFDMFFRKIPDGGLALPSWPAWTPSSMRWKT